MIRRIILFLWVLFVAFFAYRRYDKPAADNLLYKIKNLSFSKSSTSTTTIYSGNASGDILLSGSSLWEKIIDTLVNKNTTGSVNDETIRSILTTDTLEQGVTVPWITGKVIIQTGHIDTISAEPIRTVKSAVQKNSTTLSEEDKRQAEEFSNLFTK